MMKSSCVFLVLAVFVAGSFAADSVCTEESLCKCTTSQGTIDLTPLSSKVDSYSSGRTFQTTINAVDTDVITTSLSSRVKANDVNGKDAYIYSPCSDNITSPCMDAMLCKMAMMSHSTIGKSAGESFIKKGDQIAILYPGDDNTSSTVYLKCDPYEDGELTIKDSTDESFEFELATRYACLGGSGSTTTKSPKSTSTPKAKSTTTTRKSTKTTSKTTKTTPKTTKTSPKSTKTTPKGTKTTPKSTKTTPKGTKTTSKTNTTPKVPVTTHNGAASHSSISIAAVAALALVFRQLF